LSSFITQNLILYFGVCCYIVSIVLQNHRKSKIAIIFLCLGSFFLFSYSALSDPFLNIWDERFHALVAKNLLQHPLMPTLYNDPVINMNYDRWDRAIIWLHKQPFFLWQISLSYKLFGINEFTTRLPSVISGSFLILISYRTGKLLLNQDTGYFAAFLFATSFYLAELISGRLMVDHNDVSFLFYVSASIWAWVEYVYSGKKRWIIWIGIFSGIAILCKWMVGLAVFSGWLVYVLFRYVNDERKNLPKTRLLFDFFIALLITAIVILPWQLLIFHLYPADAIFSYKENSLHFMTVFEGHGGPWWFYFSNIKTLYGLIFLILLPIAVFISIYRIGSKAVAVAFLSMPLFVYIFFTLSKTKMPGFTFVISLPLLFSMAVLLDYIITYFNRLTIPVNIKRLCVILLLSAIGFLNLRLPTILANHSQSGPNMFYRSVCIQNKKVFESLKTKVPLNSVIFNLYGRTYVDCMFYSGLAAYNFIPSVDQYTELKRKNKIIVIFLKAGQALPRYLQEDKSIVLKRDFIRACE